MNQTITEAAEAIRINFAFEIPALTAWWVCHRHALFGTTYDSLTKHVMRLHGIMVVSHAPKVMTELWTHPGAN